MCAPRKTTCIRIKMATEVNAAELDVEELNVTSAVLMGAAHHYGRFCVKQNDAFMKCRMEGKDPRKCLAEGRAVTACALDFFRKVKSSCNEPFTEHWTCLDYNNQTYEYCRKTQKAFDGCMLEKLNLERAVSQREESAQNEQSSS